MSEYIIKLNYNKYYASKRTFIDYLRGTPYIENMTVSGSYNTIDSMFNSFLLSPTKAVVTSIYGRFYKIEVYNTTFKLESCIYDTGFYITYEGFTYFAKASVLTQLFKDAEKQYYDLKDKNLSGV